MDSTWNPWWVVQSKRHCRGRALYIHVRCSTKITISPRCTARVQESHADAFFFFLPFPTPTPTPAHAHAPGTLPNSHFGSMNDLKREFYYRPWAFSSPSYMEKIFWQHHELPQLIWCWVSGFISGSSKENCWSFSRQWLAHRSFGWREHREELIYYICYWLILNPWAS